jgi:uncharacterized membrane protein
MWSKFGNFITGEHVATQTNFPNELPGTTRVEAFSDGVLAIVITLLVLEIKVPHLEAAHSINTSISALLNLIPKFLGYFLSFFFIAVFWVNHHRFFLLIKQVDNGLLWLNNLLLLSISFTPFPTAWIGEYPNDAIGLVLFSFVLILAGIVFNIMWRYANRAKLFHDTVEAPVILQAQKIGLVGPLIYFIAGMLSFILPLLTWLLFFVVPIIYAFPQKGKKESAQ